MPAEDYLFRNGSILTTRERLRRLTAESEPPRLYAQPTFAERMGWIGLACAGVAVCSSIGYSVVATVIAPQPRQEIATVASVPLPAVMSTPLPPVFYPAPVVMRAPPPPMATDPLRWEDLTLMLRTGLQDDEIIAEAGRKQLVLSIDPTRERILRSMGAGNRLIGYLRAQRVYVEPAVIEAERVAVTARPAPPPTAAVQPAYQPAPVATPDYAARDRQIQGLKTQIDALDEQVRCIRTNPRDNRYWYYYYGRSNGIDQQALDAYLNNLDKQRNDLRRQKWQLEGR